jgi:RimJ/RimL family protein N-acetyltransferase
VCIVVGGQIVGWVDYDTEPTSLPPTAANIGDNVFAPYRRQGYATRAVLLLLEYLRDSTDIEQAVLAIDVGNEASFGVARAVGAVVDEQILDASGEVVTIHHLVALKQAT